MTKHKRSRIGLTKALIIHVNEYNWFAVYGDSIGDVVPYSSGRKKVKVKGKHHNWDDPPDQVIDNGPNSLLIRAYCHPRHSKPARGDDDLTVTITLDQGTGTEDVTNCSFPDVEHDD